MRVLVVLPSYNESENIEATINSILAVDTHYDVCVVDDSSPDGTSELVAELVGSHDTWADRVHLITRAGKGGRGGAVRAGFAWGVAENRHGAFVEMDCDHSHDPVALPDGIEQLEAGNDVVIGRRYPDGVIIGWPRHRRFFSAVANYLARLLLVWSVTDYTNGYRFYTPAAATDLVESAQHHTGFIYLSESLAHLMKGGARVGSFPITFRDRSGGESSADFAEVRRAFVGLFQIAWRYRTRSR